MVTKVGIAGIGAVGATVARMLDRGGIPGCRLAGVAARTVEGSAALNADLEQAVPDLHFEALAVECDCVVEALPPDLFGQIAEPVLRAGKQLVVLSASQLLGRNDLLELAADNGGRILVASGAMLGLDALKAVKVGLIRSVTIETRKPVEALASAPYVAGSPVDLGGLDRPKLILAGSVTEVAREFPANVNVAAAVSLAGLGPDKTRMEIWADPDLNRNTHTVRVTSDSSDFTVSIQNRPSQQNPATGLITAQSVIALLRQQTAPLCVGT